MRYDLTDLRLITGIAETGSLTGGAAQVHLAPSSASHRLRLVEEDLATPLFSRHARGLKPTPAGEALLRHARRVLAQLDQMRADLAPYAGGLTSQVTLFANTNATNCFLPEDLGSFLGSHPQVRVSLEEHPSPAIIQAVAAGQVDIGVVAAEGPIGGVDTRPYRQDRLVLVVPAGHPLAARARIRFAEVLAQPFVCLHAGSAIHTFMMNLATRLGRPLDVRIQVRGFNAVCRMVGAGVGIAMVPRSSAPGAEGAGWLPQPPAVVEIDEPWAQRDLQLCCRNIASLSPSAAALFAHLATRGACPPGQTN